MTVYRSDYNKELLLKLPIFVIVWVLYILLWIPLCILGHIILPPLLLYGSSKLIWPWMKYSEVYKAEYFGLPWWAYFWSNEGDGVCGSLEYREEKQKAGWSDFRIAWTWSAVRNPVNNLRFVKPFRLDIQPTNVQWTGSFNVFSNKRYQADLYNSKLQEFWCLTWQSGSFKAGFLKQYRNSAGQMMKFQIGWKIYPKDFWGFDIPYRQFGAGNAIISWRKV